MICLSLSFLTNESLLAAFIFREKSEYEQQQQRCRDLGERQRSTAKGNLLWTQAARKQMKLDMADENKKKMHPDTLKATSNVYALYDRRMIRRKMEQEIFQHKSTNYWNEKKQEIEKNKKIYK